MHRGGAEAGVTHAVEIGDLHLAHDRMRRPAEEGDPLVVLHRLLGLGEHSSLGRFDEIEAFQPVLGIGDHLEHDAVTVIAGLDAVHLAVELVLELADILQALDAGLGDIGRHDDAVTGTLKVLADRLDRALVCIFLDVGGHRRHPVAEEDVEVVVLERCVGDRYRQDLDVWLITESLEQDRSDAGGRLDIGPADVREPDFLATFRVRSESHARR